MIDVGRVYNIVRDIANKDQKGFVTPNVFNSFAQMAQTNVYNEMFKELRGSVAARRSGRDAGRDKSAYKMVEQDLSMYIQNTAFNADIDAYNEDVEDDEGNVIDTVVVNPDGAFTFNRPLNMVQDISMTVADTNTSVEMIYDAEKLNRVLNSNLSAPTEDFPVCLVMQDVYQVFPADVGNVVLRYYRRPQSRFVVDNAISGDQAGDIDLDLMPTYAVLALLPATGQAIQDPNNSRNFDLPPQYLTEVVYEMCELIGINLRDPLLLQYAMGETKAE